MIQIFATIGVNLEAVYVVLRVEVLFEGKNKAHQFVIY
jgi:hypothetical protein